MNHYKASWWTLDLSSGWTGKEERECHTFTTESSDSAFQISDYQKESSVTDVDLREFAGKVPLRPVILGALSGFESQSIEDDSPQCEWWLRADRVMIYATYIRGGDEVDYLDTALSMLVSLRLKR